MGVIFPTILVMIRMTKALFLLPMHWTCLTLQAAKSAHDSQRKFEAKPGYFYGLITADAALLHAESDDNEESPLPRSKSLLLAHWTSIHPKLEDRIKTLILHLAFFCNLTSLLACSRDENDASKVQIRIRVFLRSKYTAVTALAKLLPPSHGLLSGSWQRCEGNN